VTESGLVLDIVDGQIRFIEILNRAELPPRILEIFGDV
jgi:hypothetical protein